MKNKYLSKSYKFIRIVKEGLLFPLLKFNIAAGVEHCAVLKQLNCKHIIDIGANRGQFALIARKYFPRARIDSFEPLLLPAKKFNNYFNSDKHVKLHRIAIGTKKGKTKIHISSCDDSSSLLPITETQTRLFPGTEERTSSMIEVAPLYEIINEKEMLEPALLKIDVQGFEMEVLRGSKELLGKFKYIYVECSFVELYKGQALADEVIAYLHEKKYILAGVYNSAYDDNGKAIQADFLFISR